EDKQSPIASMSKDELVALREAEVICSGIDLAGTSRLRDDLVRDITIDEVDDSTRAELAIYMGLRDQEERALVYIAMANKRLIEEFHESEKDTKDLTTEELKSSYAHYTNRYLFGKAEDFLHLLGEDFKNCLEKEKKADPESNRS